MNLKVSALLLSVKVRVCEPGCALPLAASTATRIDAVMATATAPV
jgi:hypothetical protein